MAISSLTALPEGILSEILRLAAKPEFICNSPPPSLAWRNHKQFSLPVVNSVRLTCRKLSRLAKPLFLPILHVSINYRSIQRFELQSMDPTIAAHVRAVVVNLATYPSDMATSLAAFKKRRLAEFDRYFRELDTTPFDECDEEEEYDYRSEGNHRRNKEARRLLRHEWHLVEAGATDEYGARAAPETTDGAKQGNYGHVLLSSYKEFARRHREQLKCLNDPQTMQRLAKAFSRLACGGKMQFLAEHYRGWPSNADKLLDNPRRLFHFMVQPYSWERMQSRQKKVGFEMIKVLSGLPVALADAGVPLTELYLDCFPVHSGFTRLLSHEEQQAAELEAQLHPAFQHLRVFNFGYRDEVPHAAPHEPLPASDLSLMRAYLQAALASPQLQTLSLQFIAYGIRTQREFFVGYEAMIGLGPLLHACMSAQLTKVDLKFVDAKADELAPFFSRLGPKLRNLSLSSVRLLDGAWVPLLDAVHESTAQRGGRDPCRASLWNLYGGGLDEYGRVRGNFEINSHGWYDGSSRHRLIKPSQEQQ